MTLDMDDGVRASRMRVPRTRGALSGISLVVLGAWAALVPFIGPYFHFAFSPAPTVAWHWTTGRGWLEVAPGAAAAVAGLLLLFGTHRLMLSLASWLGVASGAWLVVGPAIAPRLPLATGTPAATSPWIATLELLFFFYAIGAAVIYFAAAALGRLSVHGVRDVRAAQRRAETEAARNEAARQEEERRLADDRAQEDGYPNDATAPQHQADGVADGATSPQRQWAQPETGQGIQPREQQWAQQRAEAAAAGRGDVTEAPTQPFGVARHERPATEPPQFPVSSGHNGYPVDGAAETRDYPPVQRNP